MDLLHNIPIRKLPGTPLPELLRPLSLQQIQGQSLVIQKIKNFLQKGYLPNLILWGPPGTGKTTLAHTIAKESGFQFHFIHAAEKGVQAIKETGEKGRESRRLYGELTILFIDEIHRLNKAQQDVLLPLMESGDLILIGATTENPSYTLHRALLSRSKVFILEKLSRPSLTAIFKQSLDHLNLIESKIIQADALDYFFNWCDGDARKLLLAVEEFFSLSLSEPMDKEFLSQFLGGLYLGYDKHSDQHYDHISAFIKSMRGSDSDAALYYLARMLKSGEDPLFIARRMIIFSSEDIGNADPRALSLAISAYDAVERVGLPEAAINLSHVVCYLSCAPKSNRTYLGLQKAKAYVEKTASLDIPLYLKSGDRPNAENAKHSPEYKYPHDFDRHWVAQEYFQNINQTRFYEPSSIGFEKNIQEHNLWLKREIPKK